MRVQPFLSVRKLLKTSSRYPYRQLELSTPLTPLRDKTVGDTGRASCFVLASTRESCSEPVDVGRHESIFESGSEESGSSSKPDTILRGLFGYTLFVVPGDSFDSEKGVGR